MILKKVATPAEAPCTVRIASEVNRKEDGTIR